MEVIPGKYLFALLGEPPDVFTVLFPGQAPMKVASQIPNLRERREIPRKEYPRFVTFRSVDDPTSAELADPDNLAATFGPGVRLKSLMLEITGEPVTSGKIEHVLSCVNTDRSCVPINKSRPAYDSLNQIRNSAFRRQ